MKEKIKNQINLYINNKLLLLPTLLMFIVPIVVIFFFTSNGATSFFVYNTIIRFMFYINTIFVIMAYLFLTLDKRSRIDETIQCIRNKYEYRNLSIIVLIIILIILNLIILISFLLASVNINELSFMIDLIVKYFFMNILLPQVCSLCIVVIVSQIKNLSVSMPILIASIFLTSPYMDLFVWAQKPSVPFDQVANIVKLPFSFFLQHADFSIDKLYGFQNELYKICIVLFWMGLTLIVLYRKTLGKVKVIISGIIVAILFGSIYIPQSLYRMNNAWDGANADINYYGVLSNQSIYKKDEDVSYSIESYDLDIDINRQLEVQGRLKVNSNVAQDKFVFTLYRDYKIKSISTKEEMSYVQDGDYFYVSFKKPIQKFELDVKYSGYHPLLYSNYQAVQLPGYFAWYPMEGKKQIYVVMESIVSSYGYNPYNRIKGADFNININSPYPFFSNLNQIDNNHFHDKADSFTLIGGNVKELSKSRAINYFPLYISRLNPSKEYIDNLSNNVKSISTTLKEIFGWDSSSLIDKKFIACSNGLLPNATLGGYSEFNDYILIGQNGYFSIYDYLSYKLFNKENINPLLRDAVILSCNSGQTKEVFIDALQEQIDTMIETYSGTENTEMQRICSGFKELKHQMSTDLETMGIDFYLAKISKELGE